MSSAEPVEGVVTLRLPVTLDDDWIERVGATWRALVGRTNVAGLELDATDLRSVNARAMGLLTAMRLIAQERGATVRLRNCPPGLAPAFTAARLEVTPARPSKALPAASESAAVPRATEAVPPWWISAAANA